MHLRAHWNRAEMLLVKLNAHPAKFTFERIASSGVVRIQKAFKIKMHSGLKRHIKDFL